MFIADGHHRFTVFNQISKIHKDIDPYYPIIIFPSNQIKFFSFERVIHIPQKLKLDDFML